MCRGEWCDIKERCLRFTAKPDENQKYFKHTPIWNNECKMYLKNLK